MKRKSTFGLFPQRLVKLLGAGSDEGDAPQCPSHSEAAGRLLKSRMARPVPLERTTVDSVPEVLARPCEELQPLAELTMGEILLASTTPLTVLNTLREYGKGLTDRWREGPENIVATTIYYAATARALTSHNRKLVTRSHRTLAKALATMMENRWMPPELADLFASARKACESKGQRTRGGRRG